MDKAPSYFFPATTCALIALVPALYVYLAPIGMRYVMPFAIATVFLTALLSEQMESQRQRYTLAVLIFLGVILSLIASSRERSDRSLTLLLESHRAPFVVLIIFAIFIALKLARRPLMWGWSSAAMVALALLQNPSVGSNSGPESAGVFPPNVRTWARVATVICDRYGWSFSEVLRRFYFVGIHMELDPSSLRNFDYYTCAKKPQTGPDIPAGYIFTPTVNLNGKPMQEWLADQNIAEEIKAGLTSGDLTLGPLEVFEYFSAAPYFVKNLQNLPVAFHNMGAGYVQTASHEFLISKARPDYAVQLNDGKYVVSWNECPSHHPYCTTGAYIEVKHQDAKYRIEVLVMGDSMAQTSPWITPRWTQSWQDSFLDVRCGKRTEHFILAKNIGYDRRYGFPTPNYTFFLSNQAMLAPFKRILTLDCKPTSMTLGRASSRIDYIQSYKDLPAQAIEINL